MTTRLQQLNPDSGGEATDGSSSAGEGDSRVMKLKTSERDNVDRRTKSDKRTNPGGNTAGVPIRANHRQAVQMISENRITKDVTGFSIRSKKNNIHSECFLATAELLVSQNTMLQELTLYHDYF